MGNLGFGGVNFSTLQTLQSCTYACLSDAASALIAQTGHNVDQAIQAAKAQIPDALLKKVNYRGGLLNMPDKDELVMPNDFEIALKLYPTHELATALRFGRKGIAHPLLAYVAYVCTRSPVPPSDWTDSALRYVVGHLNSKATASAYWYQQLEKRVMELQPLADTGEKFKKGRVEGAIGPLARAVRKVLRTDQSASATCVWDMLSKKSPKGMNFINNSHEKRVEYDKKTHAKELKDTSYRTFENTVSKQRIWLKSHGLAKP